MRQPLQRKAYFKTLHIALFICFMLLSISVKSQTILVPGDVVFVSLNAGDNSFEIIPLIDVQKGTKLYVNNGLWSNEKLGFESGTEVEIRFVADIEAGTSIQLGSNSVNGIDVEGQLELSPEKETLFLYQKEDGFFRFVYGIGWGEQFADNNAGFFGSELPRALVDVTKNYLTLGSYNNYQYYIRNGASGTSKMLGKLVTDVANWRGQDTYAYQSFRTSFNILKPPVILFDQSLTTVNENEESLALNVAIYEHDGSKLTVEVAFDSLNSSLSTEEIHHFNSSEINFSGLIGDAVFEIKVPLKKDNTFEGTETGIFELKNLSKGQFGDFVTHTVLVQDSDKPKVKLQPFALNNEQALILYNIESKEVDVSDWVISRGKHSLTIPKNNVLEVGGKLVISTGSVESHVGNTDSMILLDRKKSSTIFKPGLVKLFDDTGSIISEVRIEEQQKTENTNSISVSDVQGGSASFSQTEGASVVDTPHALEITPGWKEIAYNALLLQDYPETKFYQWSEKEGNYIELETEDEVDLISSIPLYVFFEEDDTLSFVAQVNEEEIEQNELEVKISSTDLNKNKFIDGIEGLNKIINTTNQPIQVRFLQEKVMDLASIDLKPIIFSERRGRIVSMSDTDIIGANEVFWLKLRTPLEEMSLKIDLSEMIFEQEVLKVESVGSLELLLSINSNSEKVVINFKDGDNELETIQTLDDNAQLLVPDEDFVSFSLNNGNESFISKDVSLSGDYEVSFASSIMSSEEGEFVLKVGKWKDIPSDMMILVEDLITQKEYELTENWEVKFEYSSTLSDGEKSFYRQDDLIKPHKENRFVIKLISKQHLASEEELDSPEELTLHQNYPNPFNPLTTISFYIPEAAEVKLSVFNIVGQPVALLISESLSEGEHQVDWDATDMPSGMYIYQLEVGTKIMTRKMTLVK